VRGEPGDRTATSIDETIRGEYERWMGVIEADDTEHFNDAGA
jgi:hypothetical protein